MGSGKTKVCRELASLGCYVVSADEVVHAVYTEDRSAVKQIGEKIGKNALDEDGNVYRPGLRDLTVSYPTKLSQLEAIVWPSAKNRIANIVNSLQGVKEIDPATVALEAALLLEAGWHDLVDEIWIVEATATDIVRRLETRGLSSAETKVLSDRQMMSDKRFLASKTGKPTGIIVNDSTLQALRRRTFRLFRDGATDFNA